MGQARKRCRTQVGLARLAHQICRSRVNPRSVARSSEAVNLCPTICVEFPLPDRIARLTMPGDELFADITNQTNAQSRDTGKARLREPVRDQVELRVVDLDGLLAMDHAARLIWDYVQKVDLRALEDAIRARGHTPGQAPASPRLLLALWLYATSEGIGSARALARLCEVHEAYRWLCGGVSMNHHGLSDFRTAHPELLDRLLS